MHVLSVLDYVFTGLSISTCTLCTGLCFNRTQHLYMYSLYLIMFNRTQHFYMYSLYWIMFNRTQHLYMYSLYRIMFLQDSASVHVLSVLDYVLTGLSISTCTLCTGLCFNRTQHLCMYSLYLIMF